MKLKRRIQNYLMADLFSVVTEESALVYNPKEKTLQLGDKLLSKERSRGLVAEAKAMQTSELWKTLLRHMEFEANKKMYLESTNYDEMLGGKFTLWTLRVLKKKVENLSKLEI